MSIGLGPGVTFANHRIEAELGRGGMGVVYRAHELTLDRPRALKVVAGDLASDAKFKERFRREARLAASVDHPNVVAVHHAGEEAGLPYLSMSLVDGPNLEALVNATGPLDPARASRLISQIAAGLEAAHARGLVHRDVKPSNVLISEGEDPERVVVTDFGLSRLVDDDGGVTQTGDFLGSTDYVAPEQIEGG
ncbi:MAG: serine/threonine protein kinase, partial [Actinomycetota bacterium]|nr:serine/threonine protein kinase [Actinomycetota bacterium]